MIPGPRNWKGCPQQNKDEIQKPAGGIACKLRATAVEVGRRRQQNANPIPTAANSSGSKSLCKSLVIVSERLDQHETQSSRSNVSFLLRFGGTNEPTCPWPHRPSAQPITEPSLAADDTISPSLGDHGSRQGHETPNAGANARCSNRNALADYVPK
jgi:hypothetical protein